MPGFIASARGSVKAVQGPWLQRASFAVGMGAINVSPTNIITQVSVIQNGNFQTLHTINSDIFVYVFGDRITEIVVGGISFGHHCDTGRNGADTIFAQYGTHRIAARARLHTVIVGSTPFAGFLTGSSFKLDNPETILGNWAYKFLVTAQAT